MVSTRRLALSTVGLRRQRHRQPRRRLRIDDGVHNRDNDNTTVTTTSTIAITATTTSTTTTTTTLTSFTSTSTAVYCYLDLEWHEREASTRVLLCSRADDSLDCSLGSWGHFNYHMCSGDSYHIDYDDDFDNIIDIAHLHIVDSYFDDDHNHDNPVTTTTTTTETTTTMTATLTITSTMTATTSSALKRVTTTITTTMTSSITLSASFASTSSTVYCYLDLERHAGEALTRVLLCRRVDDSLDCSFAMMDFGGTTMTTAIMTRHGQRRQ